MFLPERARALVADPVPMLAETLAIALTGLGYAPTPTIDEFAATTVLHDPAPLGFVVCYSRFGSPDNAYAFARSAARLRPNMPLVVTAYPDDPMPDDLRAMAVPLELPFGIKDFQAAVIAAVGLVKVDQPPASQKPVTLRA